MKQYHFTKLRLATAVARNQSKHIKEPVYVQYGVIKSIWSMKYEDTTVLQVFAHSELPNPSRTSQIKAMFYRGKLRKII